MSFLRALVGKRKASCGDVILRSGVHSDLIVNDVGMGRFFEATRNNEVFHLYAQAVTITANHNSPLAAATATPITGIFNPPGSGRAAAILQGFFAHVSGTPAGGQPVWNAALNAPGLSANPAGTIVNGLLGGSSGGSKMRPMNSVALTGLDVSTGNLVAARPFGGAAFAGALAANHDAGWVDQVDGLLILPPGAFVGIFAGTGAGTTWVVNAAMAWMEFDAALLAA